MTELYEDPARSKQMINRTLNTNVKINANSLLLVPMYLQLCELINHKISMELLTKPSCPVYFYGISHHLAQGNKYFRGTPNQGISNND